MSANAACATTANATIRAALPSGTSERAITSNVKAGTNRRYAARETVRASSARRGPSAQPSATIANTGATTSRKTDGSWPSMARGS